jgi:adenylate kinase family enzyme
MKANVVVISGTQGSGKTTLANALEQNAWNKGLTPVRMKYADVLYELHNVIWDKMGEYGLKKDKYLKKGEKIDGPLLQVLGSDWGRKMDQNLWISIIRERIKQEGRDKFIIIDDCRFPNELSPTTRAFVVRVRLEASEEVRRSRADKWRDNVNHISETALDGFEKQFDFIFSTEGNAEETIPAMIEKIMKKVL